MRSIVTFKFAAISLPFFLLAAVRAGHAAQQQVAAGLALLPGAVLHAVRHSVRGRALRLGRHAQPADGLDQRPPRGRRHRRAELDQRPDLDLPVARPHRPLGHRQRDHHQPGGPAERADRALRRRPRGRRRLVGPAPARDVPADVAGHLLQHHARASIGVLQYFLVPLVLNPATAGRAGRRSSSTSTSTRRSSPSRTCRPAPRWRGSCS